MRTQRWRDRRESYRPALDQRFEPHRHEELPIDEARAKAFVQQHHYSGTYPAARLRYGLFEAPRLGVPRLVGVAVFSVPAQPRVIPRWLGVDALAGVELGRFVLLDHVRRNGESWFIGQCFTLMRAERTDIDGVVSYADPIERRTLDGVVVKPGHLGIIYQATNGVYRGRSSRRTLTFAPDGSVISQRALSKIRLGERGAGYAYAQLLDAGCPAKRVHETDRAYVERVLASSSVQRQRHPGNHVYCWGLKRRVARKLSTLSGPYPKCGKAA